MWEDRPHTCQEVAEVLLQGFPASRRPGHTWDPLTKEELAYAVRHCKGSAGTDQWDSTEVKYIPEPALELFFVLTQRWMIAKSLPRQLREVHQVNLPKDNKMMKSDFTLEVASTRPISVLSIWWRAFASAVARSRSLRDSCDDTLHPRS